MRKEEKREVGLGKRWKHQEEMLRRDAHEPYVKREAFLPVSTSYGFIKNDIVVEDFVGQEPAARPSRDPPSYPVVSLFVTWSLTVTLISIPGVPSSCIG